jgi:hypothetical protein
MATIDILIFVAAIIVGILLFNDIFNFIHTETKTPEQIAQEARDSYLRWHSSEVKYCASQGLELNTSYYLAGCEIVECKNITGLYTYQFCKDNKDNDGSFIGGLLIGHLLFSR